MDIKHIPHIHPHPPFLVPTLLPLVPTLRKDLFFPPVLCFLKCVLIVQGGLTLDMGTSCFNQIVPILFPFSVTTLPYC
jgi:hypothetical protein